LFLIVALPPLCPYKMAVLRKGKVLKLHALGAIFENFETGQCLVLTQIRNGYVREMDLLDRSQVPDLGVKLKQITIEAIFGIYDLLAGSYVAVVTDSEPYVAAAGIEIRRAKVISIVPLFQDNSLSQARKQDEEGYLDLLRNTFLQHKFFYSSTFEITHTQQRIAKFRQDQLLEPMWMRAEPAFFWNRDMVYELINKRADDWIVPFMSGHIEYEAKCQADDDTFDLLFISRRSKFRQGCRFTKRGVDENGNVANYVETEQILIMSDRITSYVQIRGSIPLLWSSPVHMKYAPEVFISPNTAKSIDCCERHIKDVTGLYSDENSKLDLLFINLVDNKKEQGRLGAAFKEVVDAVEEKKIENSRLTMITMKYVWFDFHAECAKKGKWANLSKLVKQVDDRFRGHGYFSKTTSGSVTYQLGVIRTNCMDNLDRTNVVQSLFARRSLLMQLGKAALLSNEDVLNTPFKKFETIYKRIWISNADSMSMMYAGTGALKVDFTKTGKRTFTGMFNDGVNSCMRYYFNNLTDGRKQDGIDLMLGRYKAYLQSSSPFGPLLGQESIQSHCLRGFIVLVSFFSFFVLAAPLMYKLSDADASERDLTSKLSKYFLLSLLMTVCVCGYIMFVIVRKGSRLGEKLVGRPRLCPEACFVVN
jgi:hypothetical protein